MNRLTRSLPTSLGLASVACLGLLVTGCSGGSDTGGLLAGGDFVVLSTQPETNGQLFLNDPIRIDFSTPVDLDSVDLTTFSFQVFDQLGTPLQENVAGTFRVGTSPGDATAGRRLEFVPVFPTNDTFDNGGFKPGRTYNVQLVGGDRINGTVLRDASGRALLQPVSFQFKTAEGTTPAQLFRNTLPGGPRRTALDVTPRAEDGSVVLNRFGAPPVEIRLVFDQPVNPRSSNIPVAFDPNPLTRSTSNRGNIFLEYDDPQFGPNWWIPAAVELEANELDSSTVILRPVGVLPNNATIRVVVESSVADISGESNVSNAAYDRYFGTFQTQLAYEQQFDALISSFDATDQIDFEAAFGEPVGEVGEGFVRAGFGFEGTATEIEFEPTISPTILNTDFTVVTPKEGAPYNVSGGIFNFKSVNIPTGITVRGQGTNPMVWLVAGKFTVGGELSVEGGRGEVADQVASANFPKAGGFGACGGGTGGDGSPESSLRSGFGETGNGPLEQPLSGGTGGTLACVAGCGRGSGGGGGSLATQGDPGFPAQVVPTGSIPGNSTNALPIFSQVEGAGGRGCTGIGGSNSRQLDGGTAGAGVFVDARNDNDFWGTGINVRQGLRITGELSVPMGGGGGGGGGDLSYNNSCTLDDPNFNNDGAAGGGGGGGGVLIVKALDDIIITDTGRISADGGAGGAGEINGSSSEGGGGGAGAGGMVILMSATGIEMNAKGQGFGDDDYNFAISADGGVCRTGNFGSPIVLSKYPATGVINGSAPTFPFQTTYDRAPLGGFGGMGIVQLMAPPGPPVGQPNHNADNSNTILDDHIRVIRLGVPQTGLGKTNTLAWRGYPSQIGQLVDDFGNPTPTVAGDIRPQPVLLPTPFAEVSRLRSKWLDTGASKRRVLNAADDAPRGIIDPTGTLAGPTYQFAGIDSATGYVSYETVGEISRVLQPAVGSPLPILSQNDADVYRGNPAYSIDVAPASLGSVVNFYVGYEAELYDDNDFLVGSYRILAHSDSRLRVSTESGPLAAATKVQLRAKFFKVMVDGVETLGGTYPGSLPNTRVPTSNIRIGFAFHTDPGNGGTRYPAGQNTYVYNLDDPNEQENIRMMGATFVQFDILFDSRFRSVPGDNPPLLNPDTSRPELHFLRLPFRF